MSSPSPLDPQMKPRPNHRAYLKVLRGMSPEARARKAFELSDMTRTLLVHGLRKRFPEKTESEIQNLAHQRIEKCSRRTS